VPVGSACLSLRKAPMFLGIAVQLFVRALSSHPDIDFWSQVSSPAATSRGTVASRAPAPVTP